MKRVTTIAVAVGLALGAAVVSAQPFGYGYGMGGGPGMMMGGGMGPGMMGFNVEDRLAAQKSALKITPEQEKAWSAYAAAVKSQSDTILAQHEAMWKSAPSSSAERYEQHSKFMQQRALTHEALSAAYKELYSALTPEQRTAADQGFGFGPRGGYGPRGWR